MTRMRGFLSRLAGRGDDDADLPADDAPPEIEQFVTRDPSSLPPDEGDMTREEWEAQHA